MTGRTRSRLVARLARRGGAAVARATVFAALIGSGGVGFLSSALLLWSGLSSMPVRYGVSAALGYATFLLILRVAVSAKRWNSDPDVDIGVPEVHLHDTGGDAPSVMFAGGRSGGAGGGASWGDATSGATDSMDAGLDVDIETLPLVLVGVVALAGVAAVGFVVYTAPILLAEIALDVAVVSVLTRRVPRGDARHWMWMAIRRTWLPACGVVLSVVLLGAFLTWLAPEATSVGGVFAPRTS